MPRADLASDVPQMAPTMRGLQTRAMGTISVTPTVYDLIVALLVLVSASLVAMGILLTIRHIRRVRRLDVEALEHAASKGLTTTPRRSRFPFASRNERAPYPGPMKFSGPLPEIRIHLSEDVDETGEKAPSRVVVVRFGQAPAETEPFAEFHGLPPYRPLRDPRSGAEMREKH